MSPGADYVRLTRWLMLCWLGFSSCVCAVQAQSDAEVETSAESDGSTSVPATKPVATPKVLMLLQVGAGVTQRSIDLPTAQGRLTLGAGVAPALEVRASARLPLDRYFVRVRVGYQTSLSLYADDRLRNAPAGQTSTAVRSHRFEGGVAPGMWLGGGPGSAALSVYAGYGLRAFSSVTPLLIPSFTLHGPLLRVELELPLIEQRMWFQIAPEAHVILAMTDDLQRAGELRGPALAFGGEAGLHTRISPRLALRLNYRESHARITAGAAGNASFVDVERYLMMDMLYTF